MILLKIMQHERKLHIKQEPGLYKKMRRKPNFRTRNVNSSMRYVYNSSRDKHGKKYLKYLRFFSCNFPYSECKGVIRRSNCTKNKFYNDMDKNPGPGMHHVDPSKTIKAPYSQGDVVVFGQNAGKNVLK